MRKSPRPRGVTILEITVSIVLVAALLSITVQMLAALGNQRRAARQRTCALTATANLMETFTARPWAEIAPATAAQIELPADVRDVLPAAKLDVNVAAEQDSPPAKRITMNLGWQDRSGERAAPVRLTAWVFQRPGEAQ